MVGNTFEPRARGRKFLMGFVETAATASTLVTGAVVDLVGAVAEYISQVVVSTGNNLAPGVPDADSNYFRLFSDGIANTIVGTMRSRKPGVGE
jgi:hypothetical protein